jgi:hypothetical protein
MSSYPDNQDELEVAFTFCARVTVMFHPSLKQQIIDGANAPVSSPTTGFLQFDLLADPKVGAIVPNSEWHQTDPADPATCVGTVTLSVVTPSLTPPPALE